ncbi:hypothetical protein OH779_34395 [Actinacidiphila glaucinigra]|uniref:hypothetical protein n=1 Tax=Actinacidiphila glaucinigra TaxID=235986 RepID=UPI0038633F17
MSFKALTRDFAKSRMTCCCGAELPSRSHAIDRRASASILSNCAGPHLILCPAALFRPGTLRDTATHSFHTHRHRAHSASSPVLAVDDTRSR